MLEKDEQIVVRSVALVLVLVLLAMLAWVALHGSGVTIVVNGRELAGPAKLAAEGWGLLVGIVGKIGRASCRERVYI